MNLLFMFCFVFLVAQVDVSVYANHEGKSKRWELHGRKAEVREALKLCVKHPPQKRFPQKNPYPNVVLGDCDTETLKIDLDNMSIIDVKRICFMLLKRYDLEGFIILQSSCKTHLTKDQELLKTVFKHQTKSYHAVFNKPLTMVEINRILAWLCMHLRNENLTKWFFMQLQKGTYTLRIGFKGRKQPPKIIYCFGNQDKQIAKFLANSDFILGFMRGS
jgi:hypothetical protein